MKIGKLLGMMSEEYLRSDVTFGFELEAVWEEDDHGEFDMGGYLTGFWGGGEWKHDVSVHATGNNQADHPFEFASPKLAFTPGVVSKFKKFLLDLPRLRIYTNDTCSLHTHVSFPNITDDDVMWVEMQMASSPSFVKNVLTNFGKYQSEQYADPSYLDRIRESIEAYASAYREVSEDRELANMARVSQARTKYGSFARAAEWAVRDSMPITTDMNSPEWKKYSKRDFAVTRLSRAARSLGENLVDEKYSIVRMHPQGTLEWRGPRSFLDAREKAGVDEYIDLLFKFVDFVRRAQFAKSVTVGGVEVTRNPVLNDAKVARFDAGHRRPIIKPKPTIFDRFDNSQMGQTEMIDVLKAAPWLKKQRFEFMRADVLENNSLVVRSVNWLEGDLVDGTVRFGRFARCKAHEDVTVWSFELAYDSMMVSYGAAWAVAPEVIADNYRISRTRILLNLTDNWVKGRLLIVPETGTESEIMKLLDEASVSHERHFDPIGSPSSVQNFRGRVNGAPILTEEIGNGKAKTALRELAAFWRWEDEDNDGRLSKKLLDAVAKETPEISDRIEDIKI